MTIQAGTDIAVEDNPVRAAESSSITPLMWSYETSSPEEDIETMAISNDGNYIVIGTERTEGRGVYLFGKASSTYLWKFPIEGFGVGDVAISGDGSYLVASDAYPPAAALHLFNKSSYSPLWSYSVYPGFESISISGDGNTIAASQYGPPVKLYLFNRSSSTPLWIADTDTDNDGMPDGWEVAYALDPKNDDASHDEDGDGFSNLFEYQSGTDPSDPDDCPVVAMPWIQLLLND